MMRLSPSVKFICERGLGMPSVIASRRNFRLASPDLFDVLVLPRLMARLARLAPAASLTVAPGFQNLEVRLETGDLDLGVTPALLERSGVALAPRLGPDLRLRRLFEDAFLAFVRAGHPALPAAIPEVFASMEHVLVSPTGRGEGIVDPVLAERGLARRIALRVPSFAAAVAVVQETNLVLVAPGALATRAERLGLAELSLPFALPRHAINMVWHLRYDADPGHIWLREQLLETARPLRG